MTRQAFTTKARAVTASAARLVLGLSLTASMAVPRAAQNPDPNNIIALAPDNFVVYPTGVGSPTLQDVTNLQWAVDNVTPGGTVLLKAANKAGQATAFNFGTGTGHITLGKRVTLQGEALSRDPRGWVTSGATIKGGTSLLWGSKGTLPLPSVTVKDIIFDGFTGKGIGIHVSTGYNEISGCAFKNFMRGKSADNAPIGAFPIVVHGGVERADIDNVGGTLKVVHNFFGRPMNADVPFNSLMHFSNCNLELEISGNTIEDCVWGGFLIIGNKGRTRIANNVITKTRSYSVGAAIGVGVYPANKIFVSNYIYDGTTEITGNTITIGAPNDPLSTTTSYGIVIGGYAPTQTFPGFPGVSPMPVPGDVHYEVSGNTIKMIKNSTTGGLNPGAIALVGAVSATTVTKNKIEGEAAAGILLSRAMPAFMAPPNTDAFVAGNTFSSNDLRALVAGEYQVSVDANSRSNEFKDNDYGSAGVAGTYVSGSNNTFVNENFWGTYPGTLDPTGKLAVPPLPCLWFASSAAGNTVSALKNGQALQGFDLCTKIYLAGGPAQNNIQGYQKCAAVPASVKTAMVQREMQFRQKDCQGSGGTWSGQACTCAAGYVLNPATGRCEANVPVM